MSIYFNFLNSNEFLFLYTNKSYNTSLDQRKNIKLIIIKF